MISELETPEKLQPTSRIESVESADKKEESNDVMQFFLAVGSIVVIFGIWAVLS